MEIYIYMAILVFFTSLILVTRIILQCFPEQKPCSSKPRRPGAVAIAKVDQFQEDDMSKYKYTFTLPAPGAKDVVKRELHCTINGEASMFDIDPMLGEYTLTFEEDANVSIYLIDIDDADNRSPEGAILDFVVIDTVPPNAPESVVIKDVEEVIEEPAAEEPVMEEPVAEEPVAEEPVIEEPVAEEPVAEEPVMEEPVAEEPVAEEPVAEEPVMEEPVAEEPVAEEPVAEEPVMEEPVAEEPVAEEPVMEEPVAEEPVAEEPVAEEPAAEEPKEGENL